MSFNYSPKIITESMLLYLDASNPKSYPTSGTSWYDISRNSNNGTLTNGPTFDTSNLGNIVFDGTNDFIQLGSVPSLQFSVTDPYSISMWVYWTPSVGATLDTVFSYGYVAGAFPTIGDKGYYLILDNNILRNQSFLFDYYDGSGFKGIEGNVGVIPTNSWFNIVATSSSVSNANGLKVYVNGTLSSYTIRSLGPPLSINYTFANVNIGARDATTFFNGKIASTIVYNKELSSDEVYRNFQTLKGRFGL